MKAAVSEYGRILKKIRENLNITQNALGALLKVDRHVISDIENNKRKIPSELAEIVDKTFNVSDYIEKPSTVKDAPVKEFRRVPVKKPVAPKATPDPVPRSEVKDDIVFIDVIPSVSFNDDIDIVFTFDTTGSMYPCLTQVRRYIHDTARRLFSDIPRLRIGIIAHGDYCDSNVYVTKILDLTNDVSRVCDFIMNTPPTYGGDAPECYELTLHEARTKMSWKSGRNKVIVMIGDDIPHHVGYRYGSHVNNIDWRNELGLLVEAGINVYGVHAMPGCRRHSKHFYEEIAKTTGGFYLTLDQFEDATKVLMAICYQRNGQIDHYVNQFISTYEYMSRSLRNSFDSLRGIIRAESTGRSATGLSPVPSGRFQMMRVDRDTPIADFIREQGVTFEKGRGFYELTKPVDVQSYKEVILMDKSTGEFFNGPDARTLLDLPAQGTGGTVRLRPTHLEKYKVFIQSTSVNRKLIGNTHLLYEVHDWRR
jgi:transcriptional regulator with XRE-family HTH domain